ncbi:hypothetical protein ACOT81_07180 [Streptomyces sp. WI04-05B]
MLEQREAAWPVRTWTLGAVERPASVGDFRMVMASVQLVVTR